MQTWGQIKLDSRAIIWPMGESSNLVAAHNAAFLSAIIDLQQFVPCLLSDNVSIFPQCATFYNCGITTFDAPRGRITKISVIDSKPVPPPTGAVVLTTTLTPDIGGSETQPVSIGKAPATDLFVVEITGQGSGCGKPVPQYFQVTVIYTDNTGVVKSFSGNVYVSDCATNQTQQINTSIGTNVYVSVKPVNQPAATGSATIVVNVRNFNPLDVTVATPDWCSDIQYRQTQPAYVQKYWKRSRECGGCLNPFSFFDIKPPVPTDANVPPGLPALPLGYHYPQQDTDKKHRSQHGLWALEQQKIYIAPWINSTETVVVRWDGIKRDWADTDPIDDDPLLAEAIRAYVRKDHYTYWERDMEMMAAADAAWNDARSRLIMECREETRVRGQEPSFARQSNPNLVGNLFYNNAQSFTASCPAGSVGNPVTIQIAAGLVASAVSQSDADAKAQAQAQSQATAQLNCQNTPTTYQSAAQSFTAVCAGNGVAPPPDGTPQTVSIPAGTFTSTISQADADAQALASAQQQAQSLLLCTFWNSAQLFTANCPSGQSGSPVTITVAAHTFSSTLSQADADAQALNSATTQANAALVCNGGSTSFVNTPQSVSASASSVKPPIGQCVANVTVNVPAGYFANSSIGAANIAAISYATSLAQGTAAQRAFKGQCGPFTINL